MHFYNFSDGPKLIIDFFFNKWNYRVYIYMVGEEQVEHCGYTSQRKSLKFNLML